MTSPDTKEKQLYLEDIIPQNSKNYLKHLKTTIQVIKNHLNKNKQNISIYLYGGIIRDLINGVIPNDTDLFICNGREFDKAIYSEMQFHRVISELRKDTGYLKDIPWKLATCTEDSNNIVDHYSQIKLGLYNFDFDIGTNIDKKPISKHFEKLCDFTINNLMCEYKGLEDNLIVELRTKSPFTIEQSIEHIKNKKLIPLWSKENFKDFLSQIKRIAKSEILIERNANILVLKSKDRQEKYIERGFLE